MTTRLQRPRSDRMFAGVAAGLAQYFGIDVTIMRLVFVLAVLSGLSPLVYVILWIVMPEEPAAEQPHRYDPYTGQPLQ
jgi:phage shock protein C